MSPRKQAARAANVVSSAVSGAVRTRRPRIEGDREAEILDAAVAVLGGVGYDQEPSSLPHRRPYTMPVPHPGSN